MPSAEVQEATVAKRKANLKAKNEKLKTRVAAWRAKQKAEHVTEPIGSVTESDVTEQWNIGNGTLEIGNGTLEHPVTEQVGAVDRPLPSSSLPSCIPSTTTSPSGTATTDADNAVPVCTDGKSSAKKTSLGTRTFSVKQRFLARQYQLFASSVDAFHATQKHEDESWKIAQQMGLPFYFATAIYWLKFYDQELVRGKDEEGNELYHTQTLHRFLNSPAFEHCMEVVRPIVERFGDLERDELLFYVTFAQATEGNFDLLTEEAVARLRAADVDSIGGWLRLTSTVQDCVRDYRAFLLNPEPDREVFADFYKRRLRKQQLAQESAVPMTT